MTGAVGWHGAAVTEGLSQRQPDDRERRRALRIRSAIMRPLTSSALCAIISIQNTGRSIGAKAQAIHLFAPVFFFCACCAWFFISFPEIKNNENLYIFQAQQAQWRRKNRIQAAVSF